MIERKCPMFETRTYKTAMCRVYLPDESCYWYRYFKKLIEENERKFDFPLKFCYNKYIKLKRERNETGI